MRLDKFLADNSIISRKEVKEFIKKKKVTVNNNIITDASFNINPDIDKIFLDNKEIIYQKYIYLVLNKPSGFVTSTSDPFDKTVMDLIDGINKKDLFPVGRLDKDTTGLLIITNDGEFAHKILAPKNHVSKTYLALLDKELSEEDIRLLEDGIILDNKKTNGSIIKKVDLNTYEITISDGKYHEIKRMANRVGANVVSLKRISFGKLKLDDNLEIGKYKEIKKEDII